MSDELALKVRYLEKAHEDGAKSRKYIHNMIENLGVRIANIERSAERFEVDLTHRTLAAKGLTEWLEKVDERLRTMERLVYIALGGVIVIGALVSIIGGNILKLLSHG